MSKEESDFLKDLQEIRPRLRLYALSLTRDRDQANDLVQDTVLKALQGRASFKPDTNFSGWIFRIQRNEFISSLRRLKPTVPIDTAIADSLTQKPHQENGLVTAEFVRAFASLSIGQKTALKMAVLDGMPYDEIAIKEGVGIGTIKSRVSRARSSLTRLFESDSPIMGPRAGRKAVRVSRHEAKERRLADEAISRANTPKSSEVRVVPKTEYRPQRTVVFKTESTLQVGNGASRQNTKPLFSPDVLDERGAPIVLLDVQPASAKKATITFFGLPYGPAELVMVGETEVHVHRLEK